MHALSLQTFTPDSLQEMFDLTEGETDERIIYDKFKTSNYVEERPYRTYLLSKMTALREVYIKEPVIVKDVAGKTPVTQDRQSRTQGTDKNMYGE